jgi:hypothetical protein
MEFLHNVSSTDERKQIDSQKTALCKKIGKKTFKNSLKVLKGLTLIEIPFWWNRAYESLEATIYNYRPDLFTQKPSAKAIPVTEPHKPSKSESNKNAPFLY